ncbi:cytochrome c oxidase subunit 6b-1-like isoform X2 [Macadamia integrifolia]|uniref:cytochrome c oxidase subunit 6b-1-like isoform X2 n=1 Tax=Macadamia integrifolia TaxID=60698 RepID=UPI001C4E8B8E|nr:cytochrome c oxidase subunit 6b-1-like isoform X2 [Macadamia integrifolia]
MAEVENQKAPSLAAQYSLQEIEEQPVQVESPVQPTEDEKPANTVTEEAVAEKTTEDEKPANTVAEETVAEKTEEAPPAEESNAAPEQEESSEQEASEETPEIKLETAPADIRFPTTNQTRHCFTRYIEYHRCIAAKGEGAPECDKFAKFYRSLCPSEWVLTFFFINREME